MGGGVFLGMTPHVNIEHHLTGGEDHAPRVPVEGCHER
jgi:hypothetical protein